MKLKTCDKEGLASRTVGKPRFTFYSTGLYRLFKVG